MDKETAIDKIKKCLALAKSDNPHEAAAALRQAQKLMALYKVDALDISLADVSEEMVKAQNIAMIDWETALANLIAGAFGCKNYSRRGRKVNGNMRVVRYHNIVFVGVGSAPLVAQYAFDVLSRQCGKARRAHIAAQPKRCLSSTKTARGDEFAYGWVHGVEKLVERFAGNTSNDELIGQYLAKMHPEMQQVTSKDRSTGRNTKGDYAAGKIAAGNAKLDRGVGANKQERLS